jgi:DNA-binding GntR family transcriptional regulator
MTTKHSQLNTIESKNLRVQIEERIRTAILGGVFKPGERIVESVIANQMGVSRAPVREVLSALENEGLVINSPRRGNFVITFTEKDIDEIYSLRALLEVGALRRAMDRFQEEDFTRLETIARQLGEAVVRKDDQISIVNLDLSFHEYIYIVADHSRMYAIWKTLRAQTQLLISITSKTHYDYPRQPMQLHMDLINVFQSRDMVAAERCLLAHIQDAQKRALDSLRVTTLPNTRLDQAYGVRAGVPIH